MVYLNGKSLLDATKAITEGEENLIANLANISSLIYTATERINWAGFYLSDGETLVLGPFQGKPACTRIPLGKGVCGTAAVGMKTIVVDDVSTFTEHIVCDSDSKSEIVVPIVREGRLLGVLDIDSPFPARFTDADKKVFENLAEIIGKLP